MNKLVICSEILDTFTYVCLFHFFSKKNVSKKFFLQAGVEVQFMAIMFELFVMSFCFAYELDYLLPNIFIFLELWLFIFEK